MDTKTFSVSTSRNGVVAAGTVAFALAATLLGLSLAGCDKDRAVESTSRDEAWKVAPRVFAGDLTEDELRTAEWVRVEASRSGTVIAYAETLFSARGVNLTIPTPGAVSIAVSGYDDSNRTTLLWRGSSSVESGTRDPVVPLAKMPGLMPVPKPRFSVDSGVFRGTVKVGLAVDSSDLEIHYTTDGGDPSRSSLRYTDSVVVDRSMVLSAVAYRKGRALSEIVRSSIVVKRDTLPAPKFSESAGEYARILQVSLSCDTAGARIHYTTDGSEPDASSPVFSNSIRVASDTRIKAFAAKNGLVPSTVRTVEYVIRLAKLGTPRFTPAGRRFDSAQMVSIAADSGATIRYTTVQGETPDASSAVYTGPIRVGQTMTISAIATMEGRSSSDVAVETFAIVPPGTVATPWAEPAGSTYRKVQSVVLKADSGATVRYTTNGADPDGNSPVFTGAIAVDRDLTIKAIATKSGMVASSVFAALYRIRPDTVAVPRFSPAGGDVYEAGQNVSITCDTADADIRYTLDGDIPTMSSAKYERPIVLDSSATLRAIAFKTDLVPSAMAEASFVVRRNGALPEPQIDPQGGVYPDSQKVSMRCDTADAQIRYTLDGREPTETSPLYEIPFMLRSSATIKAIAVKSGRIASGIASADFTINVTGKAETPRFSPDGADFGTPQTITIFTRDTSLAIRYTTDGSKPSSTSSLYTEPIQLFSTTTLKAVAFKDGLLESDVKEARFNISIKAPDTVKTPAIQPNGGTFTDMVRVGLSADASDARIHYTLDGRDPDESSPVYTDSVIVDSSRTLKAIACRDGMVCSRPSVADFNVERRDTVATPELSLAGGTFGAAQSVTLKCVTDGAVLRYTLDGKEPTQASASYKDSIRIESSATLKVIGFHDGMVASPVAEETYVILRKAAAPTFSLPGKDTLREAAKLGLSCATSGASIYYTVDGSEPDSTGNLYKDSLVLSSSQTVKAIAFAPGMLGSDIASEGYVYAELGSILAPTITPSGVLFLDSQSVKITSWGGTGDTTWYTIDGSDPTSSSTRKLYSGIFTLGVTSTIKAYTTAPGKKNSAISTATITKTTRAATPTITPATGSYSGTQSVSIASGTSGATIYYTLDGSTPTSGSSVYTAAFGVSSTTKVNALAVKTGLLPSLVGSETITILPKLAVPTISVKTGTYTTIQKVALGHAISGTTIYYTLDGTAPTTSSNVYSDTLAISSTKTITAMAVKTGYATSGTNSVTLTINLPKIDTLTFSLAAGTYVGNQVVTITSPVTGSTIYYTTDGNPPTTRSGVYLGKGITISANTTLKAIAVKTGYTTSDVKSRTYNIRCWAPSFDTTAGIYTSVKSIAIASATSGASVYYTIDGTTPSDTNGLLYTAPVTVSYSQTLRAVAIKSGLTNSYVAVGGYTINITPLSTQPAVATFSPSGGTALTAATKVTLTAATGATIFYTTDWSEPTKASPVYSGPITVSKTTTIKARVFLNGYYSPVSGRNFVFK